MTELIVVIWATLAFTAWQFGMFGPGPKDPNEEIQESARKILEKMEADIRARSRRRK